MSKKIALLFAGQGAQAVGMGKDLVAEHPAAASLFQQADEALGFSLSKIAFEGPPEELTKTSICQPALYVHGLACLAALKDKIPGFTFHATAGLSLGEFTAHAAAGTFDFETGLDLVAQRSQGDAGGVRDNRGRHGRHHRRRGESHPRARCGGRCRCGQSQQPGPDRSIRRGVQSFPRCFHGQGIRRPQGSRAPGRRRLPFATDGKRLSQAQRGPGKDSHQRAANSPWFATWTPWRSATRIPSVALSQTR